MDRHMQAISEQRDRGQQYGLYGPLAIFSGTANPELAQEIAHRLDKPLGQVSICQFHNQNIFAKLNESVHHGQYHYRPKLWIGQWVFVGDCPHLEYQVRARQPRPYRH